MRLIDADKISYVDLNSDMPQSKVRVWVAFKERIDRLPTIEAESRWIPVTEKMPEMPFGCLVTVWDTNPITMDEFENILPYFVGWDGEQWNDADGEQCPFEVIAWMPLPGPWKGADDDL